MKLHTFKSTRGGKFNVRLPSGFKKVKLPFLKEWIAALEGGKFRQCSRSLCELKNKRYAYCCLGVLSKIQGRLKDGLDDGSWSILSPSNPVYETIGEQGRLPVGVTVYTDEYDEVNDLVDCNDTLYLSFKDIAKIVKTLYKA